MRLGLWFRGQSLAGFKRTELASRVFDHVSMRYKKGFRLLTLGWTDGCTFLPINYSLLASNDDEKVLGPCNKIDRRTIAGKRRLMACQKATSVMVDHDIRSCRHNIP